MTMTEKVLERILSPSEEVRYQFSLGNNYLKIKKIATICLGLLVILGAGVITLLLVDISVLLIVIIGVITWALLISFSIFYFDWYLKRANIYLVTNKRIIIHKGWLCTRMVSASFDQITDIKVIESLIDRLIFKVGILKINTAGTDEHAITLSFIENPYKIKKKLNEIRFFSGSKKERDQIADQTLEPITEKTKQKNQY